MSNQPLTVGVLAGILAVALGPFVLGWFITTAVWKAVANRSNNPDKE